MSTKHFLSAKDIVYMNIIGIVSLRQIPNVAPYGASSILLWFIATFCFFIPLALVCGELSTKYSKNGGMFLWIKEAFGLRIAWICTVFYLMSCVLFFPMLLFFGFSTLTYVLPFNGDCFFLGISKTTFIGIGSMLLFVLLTCLNILGIKWTKIINSVLIYLGVFLPTIILIVSACVWLLYGDGIQTDYNDVKSYIPDFSNFNTIVFASSMMFAFAGLELSSMVAGRIQNPQKDFPRAIFYSAIVIVSIYIVLTFCINVIYPAKQTSILNGFSQAIEHVWVYFDISFIPIVLEVCIFLAVVGQVNSWLVGPMYMLKTASKERRILGRSLSKLHPKYKTPYVALICQAIFVCLLCMVAIFSSDMEQTYWSFTSLTTLCYFVPYLLVFPSFLKLRKVDMQNQSSFKVLGKYFPVIISIVGMSSVVFAIFLTLIPPAELKLNDTLDIVKYVFTMFFGPLISLVIALLTCKNK